MEHLPSLSAGLYIWSGICIGVSFMDAPMKFTTPSLERKVAFDVGRTLFGLLHNVERAMFVLILAMLFRVLREMNDKEKKRKFIKYFGFLFIILLYQQFYLNPILLDRIQQIIDGKTPIPSKIHLFYVFSEFI
eukprot:492763_1